MVSTMLYNELAVIAMMAGKEYCISSLPIGAVPNSVGAEEDKRFDNLTNLQITIYKFTN